MTSAQKFKLYFPAWTACVRANGWHVVNGAAVVDESALTEEGRQVLAYARALAPRPSLDSLRHGCHVLALGRDKSSATLTNAELDRIVTLFQLLADPDNLTARLKWDAYQRGDDPGAIARIEWFIRHAAPEAYVRHIAHDKFGHSEWRTLSLGQKRALAMTLANRKKRLVPVVASVTSDDPDWSVP